MMSTDTTVGHSGNVYVWFPLNGQQSNVYMAGGYVGGVPLVNVSAKLGTLAFTGHAIPDGTSIDVTHMTVTSLGYVDTHPAKGVFTVTAAGVVSVTVWRVDSHLQPIEPPVVQFANVPKTSGYVYLW